MFGWRKRIGYIAPDGDGGRAVTTSTASRRTASASSASPATSTTGPSRISTTRSAQVKDAAAYLGSRGVDFIVHGGGPLVVARGKGYEEVIVQDIEAAAKVPATTGVRAAMEALRHVGARRVAIASPYPGAAQRGAGRLSHRARLRDRARRRQGPAVQGHAERAARRHPCVRQRRARPRRHVRRALSPLPAMAGGAGGRCARARARAARSSPIRTRSFFVAFQALGIKDPIRGHGRLLASLSEDERCNDAHSAIDLAIAADRLRMRDARLLRPATSHAPRPTRRRLLPRQDHRDPGRRRGRRRLRRGGAHHRQPHGPAHPRQSRPSWCATCRARPAW